eukprot:6073380-Pyramimonas_sp.AAC.1
MVGGLVAQLPAASRDAGANPAPACLDVLLDDGLDCLHPLLRLDLLVGRLRDALQHFRRHADTRRRRRNHRC